MDTNRAVEAGILVGSWTSCRKNIFIAKHLNPITFPSFFIKMEKPIDVAVVTHIERLEVKKYIVSKSAQLKGRLPYFFWNEMIRLQLRPLKLYGVILRKCAHCIQNVENLWFWALMYYIANVHINRFYTLSLTKYLSSTKRCFDFWASATIDTRVYLRATVNFSGDIWHINCPTH